ncbi:alpha/beta fold hydrolase [Psychrobacillus psychrotolerans]|uniref:alpha/beta fold hydrolase n=1 Tax=Psychrobacillus psychrotolerans TaxID=126156 RepID=UPI003314FC03
MRKKTILKLISNEAADKKKAIVFIHGLRGHEQKTWQKKGSLSIPELFSKDRDLSEFDIYSFGYRTGFFLKQYNVEEISRLLVTEIRHRLQGKHSIYFITHSQGGLIARQLILHLLDRGKKDDTKRIKGVVYLAVPFGGATASTLMKWVAACTPNILGERFFSAQVLSLAIFSKELSSLRERWNLHFVNESLPDLQEKAVIGLKDQTVATYSARADYITDFEEVDEHHRSICKFDTDHLLYNSIKQFITKLKLTDGQNTEAEPDNQISSTADEYFRVHNYQQALEEYIHLVGKVKSKKMQVYLKHRQGLCHFHLSNELNNKKEHYLNNSIQDFLEAERLAGDDASYSLLSNLGHAYFELSAIRNAVQYLEKSKESQIKALEKCDKVRFLDDYLSIQNRMAITYLDMAEHESVRGNVNQAIAIFNNILERDEVLESLAWAVFNNVGRCYEKLAKVSNKEEAEKHFLTAINFYNEALEIVNIVNTPDDYILCRNNLGNAFVLLSQLTNGLEEVDKAIECFNEVYEISKKDTQSFQYCQVLNNLGITYFQFYDKRRSKDDLMQSMSYFKKSLDHKEISARPIMHGRTQLNYGTSLLYLAEMEKKEDNLNAAIKSFEWSIKLSPDPNSYQNQAARSKRNKAFIVKGLFNQDVKCLTQAINDLTLLIEEIREIDINSNNLHYSFFSHLVEGFSSLCKIEKDKPKLIQQLKAGLEIFSSHNYNFGIASLNKLIGIAYCSLYDENDLYDCTTLKYAMEYYQNAAIHYKELQDQYSTSLTLYLMALTYKEFYDQEGKMEYLKEARKNCEEALVHVKELSDVNEDKQNYDLLTDIQELISKI